MYAKQSKHQRVVHTAGIHWSHQASQHRCTACARFCHWRACSGEINATSQLTHARAACRPPTLCPHSPAAKEVPCVHSLHTAHLANSSRTSQHPSRPQHIHTATPQRTAPPAPPLPQNTTHSAVHTATAIAIAPALNTPLQHAALLLSHRPGHTPLCARRIMWALATSTHTNTANLQHDSTTVFWLNQQQTWVPRPAITSTAERSNASHQHCCDNRRLPCQHPFCSRH
jgi:hypothetical protein